MLETRQGEPEEPGSVRPLTATEFDEIRRLAYDKFGLDLRRGKEELVSARLGCKIRESATAAPFASITGTCWRIPLDGR